MQGAEPLFLPDLVCDQICQPSNEDEDEMKIDSCYRTDPYVVIIMHFDGIFDSIPVIICLLMAMVH